MLLVPLRIKIGRKIGKDDKGNDRPENAYPDFDGQISAATREGLSWPYYVDRYGGWHYDKRSGFGEVDDYNPDPMMQFGVLTVPIAFAEAAVAAFPGTAEIIAEAEFEEFYDTRAHAHEAKEFIATEVLNALRAKYGQPTGPLKPDETWDPEDVNALDPEHPAPGIVRNPRKKLAGWLKHRGCKLCKATIAKHTAARASK